MRVATRGSLQQRSIAILLLTTLILDDVSAGSALASARRPLPAFLPTRRRAAAARATLPCSLRGGGGDAAQLVEQAYGWTTNLGAPAALVAGAVIATLYESMSNGGLDIDRADKRWVKAAKTTTRLLLLSAFILQIICIFCTTVLGTHLLSLPPLASDVETPLEYLRENYEFEYLTSRISFLQGLVTWLAAIALEHFIPQGDHETEERRRMDVLIASALTTLIIAMMSFYNGHMNVYKNYGDMLFRYASVTWVRFVYKWPPHPLIVLATPFFVTSVVYFFLVFFYMEEKAPPPKNLKQK